VRKRIIKISLITIISLILFAGLFQFLAPLITKNTSISIENIDNEMLDWIRSDAKNTELQWNENALSSDNSDDYKQIWCSFDVKNITLLKIQCAYFTAKSTDKNMNRIVYVTYPVTPLRCRRFDESEVRIGVVINVKDFSKEDIESFIKTLSFKSNNNIRILISNINFPNYSTSFRISNDVIFDYGID